MELKKQHNVNMLMQRPKKARPKKKAVTKF
jgi:hypothetical protein